MQLSQKELAELLGLSSRQVHNLVEQGMPRAAADGKTAYDAAACVQWYVAFKVQEAEKRMAGGEPDPMKTRKLTAETRRIELEVAQLEGTLIPLTVHGERVTTLTERLAAKCKSFGRYLGDVQRVTTAVEASALLERMGDELLAALQETADEIDDEGPDDGGRAAA